MPACGQLRLKANHWPSLYLLWGKSIFSAAAFMSNWSRCHTNFTATFKMTFVAACPTWSSNPCAPCSLGGSISQSPSQEAISMVLDSVATPIPWQKVAGFSLSRLTPSVPWRTGHRLLVQVQGKKATSANRRAQLQSLTCPRTMPLCDPTGGLPNSEHDFYEFKFATIRTVLKLKYIQGYVSWLKVEERNNSNSSGKREYVVITTTSQVDPSGISWMAFFWQSPDFDPAFGLRTAKWKSGGRWWNAMKPCLLDHFAAAHIFRAQKGIFRDRVKRVRQDPAAKQCLQLYLGETEGFWSPKTIKTLETRLFVNHSCSTH